MTERPVSEQGAGYEAYLPAQTILAQISAAVVVTDRQGNLLYANPFAAALFGFPAGGKLLGRPVLSLAFSGGDAGKAAELAKQVLRGRDGDGTFAVAPRRRLARVRPRPGDAAAPPVRLDRWHRDPRAGGQPAQQPPGT